MSNDETREIRVRGAVQGVGFRPTVFRLAKQDNLVGEVLNDSEGVLIRVTGASCELHNFIRLLDEESPPLAKIDEIESTILPEKLLFSEFRIRQSEHGSTTTEVSADAATCDACLDELFDPDQHRYHYPFTNCTHCGPRLSIVKRIPYDRATSTMAPFEMCAKCQSEYDDPLDRRFHAQPVACFDCGPQISLAADMQNSTIASTEQLRLQSDAVLTQVNQALNDGLIVAIRGIGGFHLCCDAANHAAVSALRERKHRYAKPFALMTHQLELIEQYCEVSDLEREQLTGSNAPIVLLDRKTELPIDVPELSDQIAPGSNLYGFMLPYTPLHWLVVKQFGRPLVMTSGNRSGEPQIIDNSVAQAGLSGIADLILFHNRDIANRIDDSVLRCMAGKPRMIRRARGYAPRTFKLPDGFADAPQILACGAELKSTFSMVKHGILTMSQHQGDLEDISTFDDYTNNLGLYRQLYDSEPDIIALDQHPEYLSSKFARDTLSLELSEAQLEEVQHHHAHIASCMAENQLPIDSPAVLGIALDGLGYGSDDSLWGGEFLLADYTGFNRLARFRPIALPGGAQAIKEPWRNTYAHLLNALPWQAFTDHYADLELTRFFERQPLNVFERMLSKKLNSPTASSCGRLFDAVAAALGLSREYASYEGQGAVELEMKVFQARKKYRDEEIEHHAYELAVDTVAAAADGKPLLEINSAPLWPALLNDLRDNVPVTLMAARFHAGLVNSICDVIVQLSERTSFSKVALSGGCLQNKWLLESLESRITAMRMECLTHSRFPANDGGISLGQAAIAAARALHGDTYSTSGGAG